MVRWPARWTVQVRVNYADGPRWIDECACETRRLAREVAREMQIYGSIFFPTLRRRIRVVRVELSGADAGTDAGTGDCVCDFCRGVDTRQNFCSCV